MPIVGDYFQRPTYQIRHTIGEGRAGICRLARHEIFDRDVVQKTISLLGIPDGVAREPNLLKEAKHKHLIEVWDAQWEPSLDFRGLEAVTFICDYYQGGSIYDALMEGHVFGLGDSIRICGQILDALEYLHEDRIYVHRDVKPANILLDGDRKNAVLADLGSAGRIDPTTGTAGNYGGTPLYLAPEAQATGLVTTRSDLYSVGVVALEMLSGRFSYEKIDPFEVDSRLSSGKRALVDRLYQLPPHVPQKLRRFLGSLLNVNPAKRPENARSALRKLNAIEYVDWRRESGNGLHGEWVGSWPSSKLPEKRRQYRVTSTEVANGSKVGQMKLTASWSKPGGQWRQIRRIGTYVKSNDMSALADFFRQVESEAQESPA